MSTYKLSCPHCQRGLRVRNSISNHPLLRIYYLQCTNVACGWTARGEMVITHTMSPSAMPNPDVALPLADSVLRDAAMNDDDSQLTLKVSS